MGVKRVVKSVNAERVREYLRLMEEHDLAEIEVED